MCFLILLNILMAITLCLWKYQISQITKQIQENRKIRLFLPDRHIEKLAGIINEKSNAEKEQQIQILQEKEQLKQSFLNISHDLRTPLTSIKGYLTLLENCNSKEEQKRYISIIQAKADYLASLVQIFYDISIINNDNYIPEIEKLDINRIVTDCLLEKYNELKEIRPVIRTENSPVWIYGNSTACKRIIENLVTNAITATDGYIFIEINQNGIFTIKNSTSGLENPDISLLFQKSHVYPQTGSKGLGLFIVNELLEKINGGIKEASFNNNIMVISVYFKLYNNIPCK